MSTPIQKFYENSHVLVTGGTGFLGKGVIEKLLRSCPGIVRLYVLIRCKRGKSEKTRLDELLDDVAFSRLAEECPDYRNRIEMVTGDCALPNLGMKEEDTIKIIQNVNVVFHCAATVRFDENLKIATAINIRGTTEIIKMCRRMPQLKAMVHVSTAYSNPSHLFVEEKFYEPPSCSTRILEMAELLTAEELEKLTPHLLERWPNTYTFTKAISEHYVKHEEGNFPVCVYRPAIVTSSSMEPLPGWVDNVYGPTGVALGAGLGVIRVAIVDMSIEANIVPVDLAVNAMIAAAKFTHENFRAGDTEIKIYHFESMSTNPVTWNDYLVGVQNAGVKIPSSKAIWYYSLTVTKYPWLAWFLTLFLHFLPAVLIDSVARIIGKPPQMVRAYQKIEKLFSSLRQFSTTRQEFTNYNVRELLAKSSDEDKQVFNFDIKTLNWKNYWESHITGARTYILKESLETVPYALIKWRRLYWLHQFVKCVLVYCCAQMVFWIFKLF